MAQKMVATKRPTAGQAISLRTADQAMIAPHPNAMPRMAWGSGRTRLASGDRTTRSNAAGARALVRELSRKTRPAAMPITAKKTATAALGSHFLYNAAHMWLPMSNLRHLMRFFVVATVVATLGCGQKLVFPRLEFKSDEAKSPSIPLTVRLEIPEALKHAQLFYKDSCGVPQAIPLGERRAEQAKADATGVFEKTFEGNPKDPADAVLSAALETGELNLAIPRREIGEYPLKVLVRLRVTVVDMEGKTLLNEPVKGEGKWTVTTDGTNCTVQGLMLPVTEALEKLSDRLVDSLTQSVKIRDWAIRLGTRKEMMTAGRPGGSGGTGAPPTASA